jgi:hypothetical protein
MVGSGRKILMIVENRIITLVPIYHIQSTVGSLRSASTIHAFGMKAKSMHTIPAAIRPQENTDWRIECMTT